MFLFAMNQEKQKHAAEVLRGFLLADYNTKFVGIKTLILKLQPLLEGSELFLEQMEISREYFSFCRLWWNN